MAYIDLYEYYKETLLRIRSAKTSNIYIHKMYHINYLKNLVLIISDFIKEIKIRMSFTISTSKRSILTSANIANSLDDLSWPREKTDYYVKTVASPHIQSCVMRDAI